MPATMVLLLAFALLPLLSGVAGAQSASPSQQIVLPTDNDSLYHNEDEKFYMYVYRKFEGQESRPWTAGKYGFVRSLKRTEDGVIATKFHEGIDIKPLKRDRNGRPLDDIRAIAAGTVVYTNAISGRSNYGKYLVIEHIWKCGPVYSLYAHLSKIGVEVGQAIKTGEILGTLGYTGSGLNRDRAHLHLELGLLLSDYFPDWHGQHFRSPNYHGKYNGMNITGLDIAALYLARKNNPDLTVPEFVKSLPVHYRVTIPRNQIKNGYPELLTRYPWLARGNHKAATPSVEISFSASGFPLSITSSNRVVSTPSISFIRPCRSKHEHHTKGFVSGTGHRGTLSKTGQRFIQLVCGQF